MERIPRSIFYDRNIVGVSGAQRRGHRGLEQEKFYTEPGDPQGAHFLLRMAARPWAYAGILFGFGFFAVFVRQADLLTQIILGAPIFEELVKFGLALLLALGIETVLGGGRLRAWAHPAWGFLRIPIALAVGAGFGIFEHWSTYSSEDYASSVWRTLFHGLSTGATMIAFQASLHSGDLRTRWLAPLPSILIHYLNNYGAIVLSIGSLAVPILGKVAGLLGEVLVVILAAAALSMLILPALTRSLLEQAATRLPVETARLE